MSILSGGKFNENWRVQTAYRSSNIRRARPACKPSACDGCRAENGSCSPTEAAPARASTPNTCSCYPVLPATVETLVKRPRRLQNSLCNLSPPLFFSPLFSKPLPYLIGSLYINVTRGQLSSSSFRENKNLPSFEGTSSKDSRLRLYSLISHDFTRKKKRNISRNASRVQKHAYFFPTQSFHPTLRDANGKRETVIDERRLLFSLSDDIYITGKTRFRACPRTGIPKRPTSRHRAGIAFHRVGAGRVKD